ncbi:MAG: SMC-Scp complex subunit ScpB [Verrucomicrobiota bacterium]
MTSETNQPTKANALPELKQVLGALLFAARKPIAASELCGILAQVAQNGEDTTRAFGKIKESDIRAALEQLKTALAERKLGLILVEVAGGFRFQTDPSGGHWVRHLLNLDKPSRLSKPALETLAIIAYRQPTTRAEIEALRGVNVDAMMRHLLELQLIRIVGRSDLPGRPLMYGTTQLFLEHFGLSSVKNLPGVEQLSRRDAERVKKETDAGAAKTDDGPENTDAGRQAPDASLEKTDPPSPERLPLREAASAGQVGGQATDDGPETTDDQQQTAEEEKEETEKDEDEDKEYDEDEEDEEDEDDDKDEDAEGRE